MKMSQNKLVAGLAVLIILIFIGSSYLTVGQIVVGIVIFAAIFAAVAAI